MDNKYIEVEFGAGATIEKCVQQLIKYREENGLLKTPIKGSFNGHMLYSDTVTLDSAFKEITGLSKAEYDKKEEERRNRYKKEEEEHQQAIPDLVEAWKAKGREVLTEDKIELWDKIVPIRLNDLYRGMELGNCLDIIKILNNGTLEEAKKAIYDQNHSGMSFGLVCSMVKEFSSKGEEFVNYVK